MRLSRRVIGSFLFVLFNVATLPTAAAADVTVFAAASLKEAMDEQARRFEASTGDKVVVSYGASNALAKQIEAGAPADIFVSADLDWMDYVDQRRLLMPNTRFDLLRNTLVLIAPASSKSTLRIGPNFGLAAALGQEKLAMANPDACRQANTARARSKAWGFGAASRNRSPAPKTCARHSRWFPAAKHRSASCTPPTLCPTRA